MKIKFKPSIFENAAFVTIVIIGFCCAVGALVGLIFIAVTK